MIEDTLRTLLAEPNLPAEAISRALAEALSTWERSDKSADAADHLRYVMRTLPRELYLQGPAAELSSSSIRVSRVLDTDALFTFVLRPSALGAGSVRGDNFSIRDKRIREEQMRGSPTGARNGVTWVGLDDEIRSLETPDEITANLGLEFYRRQERLVALSYIIDARHLRIPTVLDAGCSPLFAVQANHRDPRAFNWRAGRLGAIELVHSSNVPVSDVTVRMIGSPKSRPAVLPFGKMTFGVTPEVEAAVTSALRRVQALADLNNFVDGTGDFVDLSPRQFEEFLGALFSLRGYKTTVTKATRDGGFDVIAVADRGKKERLLLQAKRTRGKVGLSVIRELVGARWEAGLDDSHILVVATTGRFSKPARDLESQRASELRLHDYADLKAMLLDARSVTFTDIALDSIAAARSH